MMEILFICSPAETVKCHADTTPALMRSLRRRGGRPWFATWRQLSMVGDRLMVEASVVEDDDPSLPMLTLAHRQARTVSSFAAVCLRTDPPFDIEYLYTTMMLDEMSSSTVVVNDPVAVQRFNEKLVVLRFPDLVTDTLVTYDADEGMAFAESVGGRVIAKPLGDCSARGVTRLQGTGSNIHEQLVGRLIPGAGPVILQRYLPEVEQGETRAFIIDGTVRGWIRKVPMVGGYIASADHGASIGPWIPDEREMKVATRVARFTGDRGLMLVAIDVIDGHLSEVNVTSPGLLVQADEVAGTQLVDEVVNAIELRIRSAR